MNKCDKNIHLKKIFTLVWSRPVTYPQLRGNGKWAAHIVFSVSSHLCHSNCYIAQVYLNPVTHCSHSIRSNFGCSILSISLWYIQQTAGAGNQINSLLMTGATILPHLPRAIFQLLLKRVSLCLSLCRGFCTDHMCRRHTEADAVTLTWQFRQHANTQQDGSVMDGEWEPVLNICLLNV